MKTVARSGRLWVGGGGNLMDGATVFLEKLLRTKQFKDQEGRHGTARDTCLNVEHVVVIMIIVSLADVAFFIFSIHVVPLV